MSKTIVSIASRAMILAVVALCVAATGAPAQSSAGSYAASFLKIPVGARLTSSPDVVAGMRPDASLLYSNPAFLSGLDRPELFASSSRWIGDLSFSALGASIPLGRGGTVLGVGTTLLYSGGLQGYDPASNVVSEESYYDLGLDVAVSHRLVVTGLSVAVGATYLREHVVPTDGTGYAFHAGASYWHGRNLVQAAVRDFGGSVSFGSDSWAIAPEWLAGAGRVFDSSVGKFLVGVQAANSEAYGTRLRLGVDYVINEMFTLRSGLNDNLDHGQSDAPFNTGFAVHYGGLVMEYAYSPQEYFASTHTFSLGYVFGAPSGSATARPGVPIGDLAPPVPQTVSDAPGKSPLPNAAREFLLVAGSHGTLDSARAEARSLQLLKIPTEIASEGPRYRVIVGRFSTFDEAAKARDTYRDLGHVFIILSR
ncbi:MAG TPA: SPOR domain-containing protein [Candidatus Krumholzibacteria bacterium]|nr:SPOR domain-containing protein [Candidatus Krumholzibacteria bacterium]